jgi:hypothetical protein
MDKMIKVTEDGGGGITLYARDKYGSEYAHAGYEIAPENLLKDIYAILIDDYTVSDWDNNELTNTAIIKEVRRRAADDDEEDIDDTTPLSLDEYEEHHTGDTTIAYGENGKLVLYLERMGGCGRLAFFGDAACDGKAEQA